MVEKLCKNCKHWTREKETWKDTRYGDCDIIFEDVSEGGTKVEEDNLVMISDYESYAASGKIGENFGCIHFEDGETK